jgi:hypothetical protein
VSPNRRAARPSALCAALAIVIAACGATPTDPPASAAAPSGSGAPAAGSSTPATGSSTPAAGSPSAEPAASPIEASVPSAILDVAVANVLATGEVTPEHGGTITGTTSGGATWTLVIEPWAVRSPVTVELRPLSGGSEFGRVVAGVDLAPAGLRLAQPATLTVTGIDVPTGIVALEYHGEAAAAAARLVIGPGVGDRSLSFSVAHFLGERGG